MNYREELIDIVSQLSNASLPITNDSILCEIMDSLDFVNVILEVERFFNIDITLEMLSLGIESTIEEVIDLVYQKTTEEMKNNKFNEVSLYV